MILLAESHVFTSQTDSNLRTKDINSLPGFPDRYARFVYCPAYGETSLIIDQSFQPKEETWQFWKIFYSCLNSIESNDSFIPILKKTPILQRIKNKIQLLNDLRDQGIWLLDTSIVALYNKGKGFDSKVFKQSLKFSWKEYTRKILEDASPDHVIVIGKGVAKIIEFDLQSIQIPFTVLEQPNARLSSEKHLKNFQSYHRICKSN